jgi:hypothetical protein
VASPSTYRLDRLKIAVMSTVSWISRAGGARGPGQSWAVPSPALSVTADAAEQARRRASVREAVERLIATSPAS